VKVARRVSKVAPETVDDEIPVEISVPSPKLKTASKGKMGSESDSIDIVKATTSSKVKTVLRGKASFRPQRITLQQNRSIML